jgi:hypothetical protein
VLVATSPLWLLWLLVRGVNRLVVAVHRKLEPRAVPWDEIVEFAPMLGWQARPGLDVAARADCVFHFSTDEEGWRRTRPLDDADVVVLGDSFAFGWGVEDRDHFANVRVRRAGERAPRVKAVGMIGYSLVQELMVLERLEDRLDGKVVVWLVYVGNDLLANLNPHMGPYRAPYVRQEADGTFTTVVHHVTDAPWPWPVWPSDERDYAELCCGGARSQRAFRALRFLLEQGKQICDRAGARLVVVTVPNHSDYELEKLRQLAPDRTSFDPERVNREVAAACRDLDVGFVALKEHLQRSHYKSVDLHWTKAGHLRVAEVIAAVSSDQRLGAASPV